MKKTVLLATIISIVVVSTVFTIIYCFNSDMNKDKKFLVSDTTTTSSQATEKQAVRHTYGKNVPTENTTQKVTEINIEISTNEEPTQSTTQIVTVPVEIHTETVTNDLLQATEKTTLYGNTPTQTQIVEQTEQETQYISTEPPTEEPSIDNDISFEKLLSRSGYDINYLDSIKTEQLVMVDTYGTQADIYLFTKNSDIWENENLKCTGFVGSQGIGERKNYDNKITPRGILPIGDSFYTEEQPATWLNTFRITENTYWIDDVESEMYNQKVEIENTEDIPKSRYMAEDESYRYGFVIEYNTNSIDREKGTAVFMYCGSSETDDGSIAISEENIIKYLDILNSARNPYIIIF